MMENRKQRIANDSVGVRDFIDIYFRTYFSIQHIQTAALFSRHTVQYEAQFAREPGFEEHPEHQGYVLGAVFSSVAFLEATINELFSDAADNQLTNLQGLETATIKLMAKMWDQGIPRTARYPVLQKYNIALDLAGRSRFERGRLPYQDVDFLIKLRNALIHYEPETILSYTDNPSTVENPHPFEKRFKSKLALNPLADAGDAFWPKKCLGHGCAEWAVVSAVNFVDEFFKRMGTKAVFDHVRSRLGTK